MFQSFSWVLQTFERFEVFFSVINFSSLLRPMKTSACTSEHPEPHANLEIAQGIQEDTNAVPSCASTCVCHRHSP